MPQPPTKRRPAPAKAPAKANLDPQIAHRIRRAWHDAGIHLARRRQAFVFEYLIDYNGKQAAIRAGYSAWTAAVTAAQLLVIPNVEKALTIAQDHVWASAATEAQQIERELARIGFGRATDVVGWREDGSVDLVDSREVPDDTKAAVRSVKQVRTVRHTRDGDRVETVRFDFRMHDKVAALKLLGQRHGIFEKDNEQKRGAGVVIVNAPGPPPGLVTDRTAYERHLDELKRGSKLDAGETGPAPPGRQIPATAGGATPYEDEGDGAE